MTGSRSLAGVGIDIGGTNIKYVAALPDGTTLVRGTLPTSDRPEANRYWTTVVQQLVEQIAEEHPHELCIGIASPGLPAADGSCIHWMQGRMESVQGLNWQAALGAARAVPVLNDAHAALLGEVWQGAARGSLNAILFTLGTGVGGACMVDGHLLRGHLGRAGHLGHVSLDPDGTLDIVKTPGSLEDAIGECTLLQRSDGRFATTKALLKACSEGDAGADVIWQRSVKAFAAAAASIINVVDPETMIIGGGIAAAGEALLSPLSYWLEKFEWRPTGTKVRVVTTTLGEYAGAQGAAYAALMRAGAIPRDI